MWHQIQSKSPIWYFDATGGLTKSIAGQKDPNLYSMVCHDPITNQTIPVFEFVTTSHTSCNISTFLIKAASLLDQERKRDTISIARVIVVDQSWAMINSICKTFNKCTIIDYLQWSFDLILNKQAVDSSKFMTIVYLCSGHFFKSIINQCKKSSTDKRVNRIFIFAFTLLQSSTSIQQLNLYLFHIQNIFTSHHLSANVNKSIDTISIELRDRDLDKININFSDDDLSLVASKFPTSTDNESANNESSLVKGSPFAKYFDEAIDHNNQVIFSYNESQPSVVINPYFNEKLFTLIKQKLYFVSMWSGLSDVVDVVNTFPNHFDKKFNRLTNNIVEGYFGHIKHHTIQRYRQLTSELSTKLFVRLLAKYNQFYAEQDDNIGRSSASFDSATQTWQKGSTSSRIKSVYYKKNDAFGKNGAWDYINPFPARDFLETFNVEHASMS